METVYTIVKEAPLEVKPHEVVIAPLNFAEAVRACTRQRGGKASVGVNYLRSVAAEVGRRYDKSFNPYRNVVPADYAGVNAQSDDEIAAVVKMMFDARYPKIYNSYYETAVRNLPFGVRVVYVVSNDAKIDAFDNGGIRYVSPDQIGLVLKAVEALPPPAEEVSEVLPEVDNLIKEESTEPAPVKATNSTDKEAVAVYDGASFGEEATSLQTLADAMEDEPTETVVSKKPKKGKKNKVSDSMV